MLKTHWTSFFIFFTCYLQVQFVLVQGEMNPLVAMVKNVFYTKTSASLYWRRYILKTKWQPYLTQIIWPSSVWMMVFPLATGYLTLTSGQFDASSSQCQDLSSVIFILIVYFTTSQNSNFASFASPAVNDFWVQSCLCIDFDKLALLLVWSMRPVQGVSSHSAGGRTLWPSGPGTDTDGWCSGPVHCGCAPDHRGGSAPQTQTPDTSAGDASTPPEGSPGCRDEVASWVRKMKN